MMNKEQKKQYISDMTNQFEKSEAVIVTHYQGLTMNQLDDLRAKMREHGIKFKITNNRITKLALEKTRCKDLSNLFSGPTAVALSEDAITSAKILTNFSKENENLKFNQFIDLTAVDYPNKKNRFFYLDNQLLLYQTIDRTNMMDHLSKIELILKGYLSLQRFQLDQEQL